MKAMTDDRIEQLETRLAESEAAFGEVKAEMERLKADAAKWKGLYEKAMRECQFHRDRVDGIRCIRGLWRYEMFNAPDPGPPVGFMNDHDTARREAGLWEK